MLIQGGYRTVEQRVVDASAAVDSHHSTVVDGRNAVAAGSLGVASLRSCSPMHVVPVRIDGLAFDLVSGSLLEPECSVVDGPSSSFFHVLNG